MARFYGVRVVDTGCFECTYPFYRRLWRLPLYVAVTATNGANSPAMAPRRRGEVAPIVAGVAPIVAARAGWRHAGGGGVAPIVAGVALGLVAPRRGWWGGANRGGGGANRARRRDPALVALAEQFSSIQTSQEQNSTVETHAH